MVASQARILANRANSTRSKGPSTPEGKSRSRQNSLKHGLTGAGVVLAAEDEAEVERRDRALQKELAPKSEVGRILVRQMATTSVRMERSARRETAAIAERVRHAEDDFDGVRLEEAHRLLATIGEDPRANLRRLRRSPEGVDGLISTWHELRGDLTAEPRPTWTARHVERAENLTGHRADHATVSKIAALSRAIGGDFADLAESEGGGLDDEDRKAWARLLLVERIDAEIAGLEEHHETLDFETIEQDRAEAPVRALFDPSKEATLARRYESEARRGFYRAMTELGQAEADHAARPAPAPTVKPCETCAPLASSWDRPSAAPREPQPTPRPALPASVEPLRGPVGRLESTGRTFPGSA